MLAILVILGCLIIPRVITRRQTPARVQATVNEARIADTILAIQSLKSAAMARYAQTGSLGPDSGDRYDRMLLTGGFLSKPFDSKLGNRTIVRLVIVSGLSPSSPVFNTPGAYDLNGDGRNDVVGSQYVAEAVIDGVTESEATALNDNLDETALGASGDGTDLKGVVIWTGESRELRIFITQGN